MLIFIIPGINGVTMVRRFILIVRTMSAYPPTIGTAFIITTNISLSFFMVSLEMVSYLSSPDTILLRKSQNICNIQINHLVYSTTFTQLNQGIILCFCDVFMPAVFALLVIIL